MPERSKTTATVRVLSVTLALLVWVYVAGSRPAHRDLNLPLRIANLPSGFDIAGSLPAVVWVTVTGPSLQLIALRDADLAVTMDLVGAVEGKATTFELDRCLQLPERLSVARVTPERLEVRLVPSGR